jgi:hypothetical protein
MLVIVDEKTVAARLKGDENPALPERHFEYKPVEQQPWLAPKRQCCPKRQC